MLGAFARKDRGGDRSDLRRGVYDLFPILGERRKQPAGPSPAASSRCSPWAAR